MDYDYGSASSAFGSIGSMGASCVGFIFGIFMIVCLVKIFIKAGKPGWGAIIPFYNSYCLADITLGNGWLFLLLLLPGVNLILMLVMYYKLAIVFGKSTVFGILTVLCPYICLPIIAFGSAEYQG